MKKNEKEFNELVRLWLMQIKKEVKLSTYSAYLQTVNKHITGLSEKTAITKKVIDNYIEKKKKSKLKPSTLNNIIVVLNSILKFAFDDKYINQNIKVRKVKETKKKARILTQEEKARLESYLVNNLDFFTFGLLLMLYTGVRVGELSALQITDINAQSGTLSINKTLERIKNTDSKANTKTKIVIDTPKSPSSLRDIALVDFILKLYQKLYKGHFSGYLLTGTSRFFEPHAIDRKFKKILQECHIKSINIHALRHTFATDFYRQTRDIKTLSEILGHSNASITINLYVHSDLKEQKRGIEKMTKVQKKA